LDKEKKSSAQKVLVSYDVSDRSPGYGLGKIANLKQSGLDLRTWATFILAGADVLTDLGLSDRQARVYLALLSAGGARARSVAALASIPRQEVYHLLEELKQLGLVEQSITMPTSYSATSIDEAVGLLIEEKTNEVSNVSLRAHHLVRKLNSIKPKLPAYVAPKSCFGVVCEGDRGKRYQKAILETEHTLEIVVSWVQFKQACFRFGTHLRDTFKKGVNLRIITEKPSNHQFPKWVEPALDIYQNLQLETIPKAPTASFSLFDGKQAAIQFSPNCNFMKGPTLWTTNETLITTCQAYAHSTGLNK
jgi:sugar-specific transcriptional regulator TrmB